MIMFISRDNNSQQLCIYQFNTGNYCQTTEAATNNPILQLLQVITHQKIKRAVTEDSLSIYSH